MKGGNSLRKQTAPTSMKEVPPEFIRKAFPRTSYHPRWRLLTWYPRGMLNEAFADQVIEFIEMEERIQEAPFDRYADLSGLTHIRINNLMKQRLTLTSDSYSWCTQLFKRRAVPIATTLIVTLVWGTRAFAQADPLQSWNDSAAKKAIVEFVEKVTREGS